MVHGLFKSCVIMVLDKIGPGSFLPDVRSRLIEIVRYIINNSVMTLDSCQNFVYLYSALRYLKNAIYFF